MRSAAELSIAPGDYVRVAGERTQRTYKVVRLKERADGIIVERFARLRDTWNGFERTVPLQTCVPTVGKR